MQVNVGIGMGAGAGLLEWGELGSLEDRIYEWAVRYLISSQEGYSQPEFYGSLRPATGGQRS